MARQSRGWCFTVNNYTEEELGFILDIPCDYLVVGDEVGEEGTPHLQGYIYFPGRGKRFGGVKELPGFGRAHLEVAIANAQTNRVYCTKSGEYIEKGVIPHGGQRKDIHAMKEIMLGGGDMRDAIEVATSYQSMRMAELLMKYQPCEERAAIHVKWFWGPAGCGKTRRAIREAGDYWMTSRGLKWFDGYDGEKNIIVDDFRPSFCEFQDLLRIIDTTPYRAEIKGGSRPLKATCWWFTAPVAPDVMYEHQTQEDLRQLTRRIHEVCEIKAEPEAEPEVGR